MATCASCGTNNVEGTKFCVSCGAGLVSAPAPESWKASGNLNAQPPVTDSSSSSGYDAGSGYIPQTPPPSYPSSNAGQNLTHSYQQPQTGAAQPMHPAVPAIVSFFLPGIGLLFVPNKLGLGLGIFAATIAYAFIGIILTFVFVGICLLIAMPLINIAAAIHSWDEAAKVSNGQFQPILFK